MGEKKIEIIYKDGDLAVCLKPHGVACESADGRECMPTLIAESLGDRERYVGTVHRLDTVTGGLMLYSLNPRTAGRLSEAIAARETEKEYLAVVHGCPDEPSGELRDLLFRDAKKNRSYVIDRMRRGVKEAILSYRLLETKETTYGVLSLIRVRLTTGRTHQIRAQFSSRSMPLFGDGKYGSRANAKSVALFSTHLAFPHPKSGKRMEFDLLPEGGIWQEFDIGGQK